MACKNNKTATIMTVFPHTLHAASPAAGSTPSPPQAIYLDHLHKRSDASICDIPFWHNAHKSWHDLQGD